MTTPPAPRAPDEDNVQHYCSKPGIAKEKKKRKYLEGSGGMLPWKNFES